MKSETTLNLPPFGLKPGRRPALACVLGLVLVFVFVFALALPNPAFAVNGGTFSDSRWYYQIGGADSVMAPLNARVSSATISGSLNLGLGFNCSGFNQVLGIANTLNSAAKNIQGVLVNAASAAIASAPGLNLQCGSVGLYELYQQDGLRQRIGHAGLEKLRADAVRHGARREPLSTVV